MCCLESFARFMKLRAIKNTIKRECKVLLAPAHASSFDEIVRLEYNKIKKSSILLILKLEEIL